jgi:hypothetical protein
MLGKGSTHIILCVLICTKIESCFTIYTVVKHLFVDSIDKSDVNEIQIGAGMTYHIELKALNLEIESQVHYSVCHLFMALQSDHNSSITL